MSDQSAGSRSPWLPFGTSPDAAVRLLLLPHAGAGATVYRAWAAGMPPAVGACPVQPPGREKRRSEPLLQSVHDVVRLLTPEVFAGIRPPYAIFGHSTGALVAFELVRELRRRGGAEPVHVFVAGRRAPQLAMGRTRLDRLSAAELATVLRDLGGTPDEVIANHDLLRLIQPLLVADFAVNEAYVYQPDEPLAVPITAFAATEDKGAEPEQMSGWGQQTSARFHLHSLAGGHFAVFDQAALIHRLITETLCGSSSN
jgi:medium-chain acyl-[acyl-carrier-protein] hydrolase